VNAVDLRLRRADVVWRSIGWRRPVTAHLAAMLRHLLWGVVLRLTGGIRVAGSLPAGPCVIVANHSSHADTPALLAAIPPKRRPAVAAAADYWFDGRVALRWRGVICRSLTAAFPVRRSGGGSTDLVAAARLLAEGRDVIVFPEGSRTRDGTVQRFHSGALRLAATAGVPVVPIGIRGTATLLPVHGRLSRTRVMVRIGEPVAGVDAMRDAVVALALNDGGHGPDHASRGVRYAGPAVATPARHVPPSPLGS